MDAHPGLTFGAFRLDRQNAQLWRGAQQVTLKAKSLALLSYLLDRPGQLVTKDELLDALWTDVQVDEAVLKTAMWEIRKALEDNAKAPRHIATVHGRGYRCIGKVVSEQLSVVSQEEVASSFFHPSQPSILCRQSSILVGREAELSQLYRCFVTAMTGQRQIIFVTGEAGIGKTTLVDVFLQGLARVQDPEEKQKSRSKNRKAKIENYSLVPSPQPLTPVLIGRGQCIAHYKAGEAYLPWLEALGRLCREPGGDRLVGVLRHHAPSWLQQLPAVLTPGELTTLKQKGTGVTRERMLREMAEALEAFTHAQPLVLWLEGLHWSDPFTLELLEYLARRVDRARLLVIGTYRPVEVVVREHPLQTLKEELQVHGQCQELGLGLLTGTAVEEYLRRRFALSARSATLVEQMAQRIHDRTEGNPLFMVMLVDELVRQGVFSQRAGQWKVRLEMRDVQLPIELQHFVAHQIEQMDPAMRRVLEAGSTIGMDFSAASVAAALGESLEQVEERCEELVRRGQWLRPTGVSEWPDGTVAGHYSFLHALYQEVLPQRVPARRRLCWQQRINALQAVACGQPGSKITTELAVPFTHGRAHAGAVQYLHHVGGNGIPRGV